ncbi:MAG TPA: choice-of-anchor Q domain-containing protein [Kofleriaceae bacterium]
MRALRLSSIALIVASGACTKTSDKYCGLHPEDTEHCSAGDAGDAGGACEVNGDCTSPGLSVCTTGGTCAQCDDNDHDACMGTTPVCDATDHACRKCELDAECSSGVCGDDGSCADESMVAYVAAQGSGMTCTKSAPCADLDAAEKTMKPQIRVAGTVTEAVTAGFMTGTRTITGEGATVQVMGSMAAIKVGNAGTNLTIRGLTFTSIAGADLEQPMIMVTASGPRLELDRVTIAHGKYTALDSQRNAIVIIHRSVFASNEAGPAMTLLGGEYEVTNSLFVGNGANDSSVGGVSLFPRADATMHTFAFNTVADNNSSRSSGRSTGIVCTNATLSNSIVVGNMLTNCDGDYLVWNTGDGSPQHTPHGTGIVMAEPAFANDADLASPMFYRLGPTSPALDAADPAATMPNDIDGEPRPAHGRSDIGADERQ